MTDLSAELPDKAQPCAHPYVVQRWFNLSAELATRWCSHCGAINRGAEWRVPEIANAKAVARAQIHEPTTETGGDMAIKNKAGERAVVVTRWLKADMNRRTASPLPDAETEDQRVVREIVAENMPKATTKRALRPAAVRQGTRSRELHRPAVPLRDDD